MSVEYTAEDLKDWTIASDGAQKYIGRYTPVAPGLDVIHPAYVYLTQVGTDHTGNVQRQIVVLPIDLLPSVNAVHIKAVSWVQLDGTSDADRAFLAKLVNAAEAIREQVKAQSTQAVE